jgi:hypothetical protein
MSRLNFFHFIPPQPPTPTPPPPPLSIQCSVFFSEDIASEQGAGSEILQGTSLRMPKIPDYESFRRIIDKVLYCTFYSLSLLLCSSSYAHSLPPSRYMHYPLLYSLCSFSNAPPRPPSYLITSSLFFLHHRSCPTLTHPSCSACLTTSSAPSSDLPPLVLYGSSEPSPSWMLRRTSLTERSGEPR